MVTAINGACIATCVARASCLTIVHENAHVRWTFESSEKRRTRTSILDLRTIAFMPGIGTFSKLGWRGSVQDSLKVEVLFLVLRSGKLLRCLRDNLSDGRLGGAATAILTGRWEEIRVSVWASPRVCVGGICTCMHFIRLLLDSTLQSCGSQEMADHSDIPARDPSMCL